jgi:hypothetical protein
MTISRVNTFSYLPYAREMNVLVNSAKLNLLAIFVYKIIISEHLWSYTVIWSKIYSCNIFWILIVEYTGFTLNCHFCCNINLGTKLLFRNISGVILLYDQSVKSWEFRIREIRYCREGNTMLLRGKYDALVNITWDCFDQSNFYIFFHFTIYSDESLADEIWTFY